MADHGEAFDYVAAAEGLAPEYARQLFGQIVNAIAFIHSKGIAHRDLKLENVFLDKSVVIKVADFGLMKAFAGPNGDVLQTKVGTPNYMAPELYTGNQYNGPAVDVFAMGAMLFLIRFGSFGFLRANDKHYRNFI